MDFWKRLKQIFTCPSVDAYPQENEEGAQLIAHEVIQRSESEQQFYDKWEHSPCKQGMLEWVQTQYQSFRQSAQQNDCAIDFLSIPSVQGFVIHYDPKRWDSDEFICLFDYFKYKIKDMGYHCQVSDRKITRCGKKIEHTQRHFLKPNNLLLRSAAPVGEKIDQFYGNIMVSLCLINEKLVNLKFCATSYNDHAYSAARPFEELVQTVCAAQH